MRATLATTKATNEAILNHCHRDFRNNRLDDGDGHLLNNRLHNRDRLSDDAIDNRLNNLGRHSDGDRLLVDLSCSDWIRCKRDSSLYRRGNCSSSSISASIASSEATKATSIASTKSTA